MDGSIAIAEESIRLLEKAAQEADALEAEVRRLSMENKQLREQCQQAKKASSLDRNLLVKLATALESEGLLAEGMDSEKLASLYEENPNRLADIALRLLCPVTAEGQPVKSASIKVAGEKGKRIMFNGREVIDHDGWVNVINDLK